MEKKILEITKDISNNLRKLRKDVPDTLQGFAALAIGFHAEALVKLAATREEVEEALGMAVYMGGGPSVMYAADAMAAYEQFQNTLDGADAENSIGARSKGLPRRRELQSSASNPGSLASALTRAC